MQQAQPIFVRIVTYYGEIAEDCSKELLDSLNADYTSEDEMPEGSEDAYHPLTTWEQELMFDDESPELHGGCSARYVDAYIDSNTGAKYLLLSDEDFATDDDGNERIKSNLPKAEVLFQKIAKATEGTYMPNVDKSGASYDVGAFVPVKFFEDIESRNQMRHFLKNCDFETPESIKSAFDAAAEVSNCG